jgi:hypothetical protein
LLYLLVLSCTQLDDGVEAADEKSVEALAAKLTKDVSSLSLRCQRFIVIALQFLYQNVKIDYLINNAGAFAWDR